MITYLPMEGKALRDELLEYFEFDNTTPSNSSFNQRRAQILPEAFEFLHFMNSYGTTTFLTEVKSAPDIMT